MEDNIVENLNQIINDAIEEGGYDYSRDQVLDPHCRKVVRVCSEAISYIEKLEAKIEKCKDLGFLDEEENR